MAPERSWFWPVGLEPQHAGDFKMPDYRAYRLDDESKFIGASEFEAADDAEALEIVRVLPEARGFEVWCGARMVGRVGRGDEARPMALIFGRGAARARSCA
jgi:hypothetical protein